LRARLAIHGQHTKKRSKLSFERFLAFNRAKMAACSALR
jgi:hypothetical protein